jgi:hypothetical protein
VVVVLASSLRRGLGVLFERWSLVASSVSLFPSSPLGPSVSGVVSDLSWCPRTSSVLVSLDGGRPSACRVDGVSPTRVSVMVALLRRARASGRPVSLRARNGWPAASFFCSVTVSSSLGECLERELDTTIDHSVIRVNNWPVFRSVRA